MSRSRQPPAGCGLADLDGVHAQRGAVVEPVDPHGVERTVEPHVEAVQARLHVGVDVVRAGADAQFWEARYPMRAHHTQGKARPVRGMSRPRSSTSQPQSCLGPGRDTTPGPISARWTLPSGATTARRPLDFGKATWSDSNELRRRTVLFGAARWDITSSDTC